MRQPSPLPRRHLLQATGAGAVGATVPAARGATGPAAPPIAPEYRITSPWRPVQGQGMPGPYPGQVVRVHSPRSVDEKTNAADPTVVAGMLQRGMLALTGEKDRARAWRRFFTPKDVVGIKVNCVGHPHVYSSPEIVAEIVRSLIALGIPPGNVYLYDRFAEHVARCGYGAHLPAGVQQHGAEGERGDADNYDPFTYAEVSFFGEDDTRSNLVRLISQKLTKIINVPNVKDHGAAGATGCLKNIAYGGFSNVARSHAMHDGTSHTRTFIGTLAAIEPLRSRTVLQIVDGLRGVWHCGPFARDLTYVFFPKQVWVGTDPVAADRLIVDMVEEERRRRGARSLWDRDRVSLGNDAEFRKDPNRNILIREPGHVEHAARLGLGVADKRKIRIKEIAV